MPNLEFFQHITERALAVVGRRRAPARPFNLPENAVGPEQLAYYQLLRETLLESARGGGISSSLSVTGVVGDPLFDGLPEVLAVSPPDKAYVFTIYTMGNWKEDKGITSHIKKIEEAAQQRGRTRIDIRDYPLERGDD